MSQALVERRRGWLDALEQLEREWRARLRAQPEGRGLSEDELRAHWLERLGEGPTKGVIKALREAFEPASWPQDATPQLTQRLLTGRAQLWTRLMAELHAQLLPAQLIWRAGPQSPSLPPALLSALSCLGVTVESEEGAAQLCSPREASQLLRAHLSSFGRLFGRSVGAARPFELKPDDRDGPRFERLALCLFNVPVELLSALQPAYVPLLERRRLYELEAYPSSMFDDLALGRDLSLKRGADQRRGVQAARGWLQLGLSADPSSAERKASVARRSGGAHPITPHHLAYHCPETHPLWDAHDHRPRGHHGRALAIRELLRRAAKVRPQVTVRGDLKGLLAPILALPTPLAWELRGVAQELIARPMKAQVRSRSR